MEGGFLRINGPKFGFRKLLYNIREETLDPQNVYTIKEAPKDAEIAGLLDVLSFAYVYHMMVVDFIYTQDRVIEQDEQTLEEAARVEGETAVLNGIGATDNTGVLGNIMGMGIGGGGRGIVGTSIAGAISYGPQNIFDDSLGSGDHAAVQKAADMLLTMGDRQQTERWMDDYAKLIKKNIETVDKYANVVFKESSDLFQRLAAWVEPDRPPIETGFLKKKPNPNIVMPNFMLRCSDISMRFETKKKPVHFVWPGETVRSHLLNNVLNAEYFTKQHMLLRPVQIERDTSSGSAVGYGMEGIARAAVQLPLILVGGGGMAFVDLLEAANLYSPSEKPNEITDLDNDERMAVAMFTVFFAMYRRSALPSFDDHTYRYNDMNEVFTGIHSATGCMAFASDRRNDVVKESNVIKADADYNNNNRVFVVKAATDAAIIKQSLDKKTWQLDVPQGSIMKVIMPGVAFDIAKKWVGYVQQKAYKPSFTDDSEPENITDLLNSAQGNMWSDNVNDAHNNIIDDLSGLPKTH